MRKWLLIVACCIFLSGCGYIEATPPHETQKTDEQAYRKNEPIPTFGFSENRQENEQENREIEQQAEYQDSHFCGGQPMAGGCAG